MSKSRILLAGAALFITLICWSLSSPINSHQDEKFHFASILCANGIESICTNVGTSKTGVEIVLLTVNLCTPKDTDDTKYKRILVARAPDKCRFEDSPNELLENMSTNPNFFFETDKQIATWIKFSDYPDFYFKALKNFDTESAEKSVVVFRIFNSAVFVLLFVLFLLVSDQNLRTSFLFGLFATLIPHGIFLTAGMNNTSWAYTGCCFSWGFLYQFLSRPIQLQWRTIGALFGWIFASLIVITSRYDTTLILFLTNLMVLISKVVINNRRTKTSMLIIFLSQAILFIFVYFEVPRFRQLLPRDLTQSITLFELLILLGNAIKLFIATPLRLFGLQPPGWGPLEPLKIVLWANILLFVPVIFFAFRQRNRNLQIFQSFALCAFFGIYLTQVFARPDWTTPFYWIRTSWAYDQFSPRYFLPIFPFLLGILVLNSKKFLEISSSRNFLSALITILGFTHASTLVEIGATFREKPDWYWQDFPVGIRTLSTIGIASFVSFLILVISPLVAKEKSLQHDSDNS